MKTKSKKILYAVIAMSVACFLACSALFVIGRVDRGGEPATSAPAENGGMLIGESEGAGVSLLSEKIAKADYAAYGVSPLADSAYTLTATVEPANAPDKAVDWSVAFVNPSSSWATGKTVTDYVTVTPTSDGALTATVQNLKAFGEQIKVTVTHRENATATASCTVDFAKRIEGVRFYSSEEKYYDFTIGEDKTAESSGNLLSEAKAEILYSDYTIDDNFEITLKMTPDGNMLSAFKSACADIPAVQSLTNAPVTFTWNGQAFKNAQKNLYIFYDSMALFLFDQSSSNDYFMFCMGDPKAAEVGNELVSIFLGNKDYYFYDMEITATGTHSNFTETTRLVPNMEVLNYSVTKISLDDTSIIF